MSAADAVTFWDEVQVSRPAATGPRPNARLTETVAGLSRGDALDLGCGDGGDALWLAGRGWQVTAVDIAAVAVERADTPRRVATGPSGQTAEVTDHVLVVHRAA